MSSSSGFEGRQKSAEKEGRINRERSVCLFLVMDLSVLFLKGGGHLVRKEWCMHATGVVGDGQSFDERKRTTGKEKKGRAVRDEEAKNRENRLWATRRKREERDDSCASCREERVEFISSFLTSSFHWCCFSRTDVHACVHTLVAWGGVHTPEVLYGD